QADERRRSAEPLRASWRPGETAREGQPEVAGVQRLTATRGCRGDVVPILLAVTLPGVADATRGRAAIGEAAASGGGGRRGGTPAEKPDPMATEVPAEPIELDTPTAKLPEGGDYSQSGEGTWHVVPLGEGDGKRVGDSEQLLTYTVEVEDGIDPASYTG